LQIRRITTAIGQEACSHFTKLAEGSLNADTVASMRAEDFLSDQVKVHE
jgi:hypothetical protein